MYYILNETDQIIAADDTLLNLCGVAQLNELFSKVAQDENLLEDLERTASYTATKTTLSSQDGTLTLVSLDGTHAALNVQHVEEEDAQDEDALFTLLEEPSEEEIETPIVIEDDAPLDLGLDIIGINDTPEEAHISEEDNKISDITIDIDALSQDIGISSDDYHGFLNEFIDNALDLEADLQSQNNSTRTAATNTLSSLANVLHLPMVGDILQNIVSAEHPENALKSFYEVLSRITTTKEISETEALIEAVEEVVEEEGLELFDTVEEKVEVVPEPVAVKKANTNSFGTISLEGIKPKHFDFQLEEAANDLSLPVELIEEFVNDFIEQAHIETKKMLEAYEEGDLDAIQKIGHLLKGASSNLRINALSDTLYKIQFTETSDNLDLLIKDYWAHFLSFENQINVISNQKEK